MDGLYALKPWYARRLGGLRGLLVAHGCRRTSSRRPAWPAALRPAPRSPSLHHGLPAAVVVGTALVIRLAAANLDGGVARARGVTSRAGSLANELGDRLAELAALAGAVVLAPGWLVAVAALAMSAPSWVALAGAAAGGPRLQGGPVGKTERAAGLVLIALTGWAVPLLGVLAVGSAMTASIRLTRILAGSR